MAAQGAVTRSALAPEVPLAHLRYITVDLLLIQACLFKCALALFKWIALCPHARAVSAAAAQALQ